MPEIPLARGWLKARGCGGQVAGCEAVRLRAGRCKFFVIFFDGILKIPESQWFLRGLYGGLAKVWIFWMINVRNVDAKFGLLLEKRYICIM